MADGPYRVDDGVKRAKAALLLGRPSVRAELRDAQSKLLREFDVPLAGLLSRLALIDRTIPGVRTKWDRIWHGMRRDPAALPRIVVVRSSRGTPLENVTLFPSLTLMPPGSPPAPPTGPSPNPPPP